MGQKRGARARGHGGETAEKTGIGEATSEKERERENEQRSGRTKGGKRTDTER